MYAREYIALLLGLVVGLLYSRSIGKAIFLGINNLEGVKEMSYSGRPQFNRGPREMHTITCADCGNEGEVPFRPTQGRPVYCRECFQKNRTPRY